ncbi:MAG: cation diffusion facilitator family transporter [Gemmatimonadota bacterium]
MSRRQPGDCVGESCVFEPAHPHEPGHAHTPAHTHTQPHSHSHAHTLETSRRRLLVVLSITAAFMVLELIGGLLANSLALIADSAHMLTDVGALALSLFVLWFSRRPASSEKTYGYLRLEILAALVNGVALVIISGLIFWQAYQRILRPEPVAGGLMLGVAVAGLLVNLAGAWLLHGSASHNLNLRGAYLHVIGDLIGSAGAIVAALIILGTGAMIADPLISILVGLLVLAGSWKLVRESVDVLLEAAPSHIDLAEVRNAIDAIPGVDDVHDLHVWTLTSGFLAMSGHAVVQDPEHNQRVLHEIHRSMREGFGIEHVTVQLERRSL